MQHDVAIIWSWFLNLYHKNTLIKNYKLFESNENTENLDKEISDIRKNESENLELKNTVKKFKTHKIGSIAKWTWQRKESDSWKTNQYKLSNWNKKEMYHSSKNMNNQNIPKIKIDNMNNLY